MTILVDDWCNVGEGGKGFDDHGGESTESPEDICDSSRERLMTLEFSVRSMQRMNR